MLCGSVEGILAVKNHVAEMWFHYYYHTSSKNLGNETFHLLLPISATKAKKGPLWYAVPWSPECPVDVYRSVYLRD